MIAVVFVGEVRLLKLKAFEEGGRALGCANTSLNLAHGRRGPLELVIWVPHPSSPVGTYSVVPAPDFSGRRQIHPSEPGPLPSYQGWFRILGRWGRPLETPFGVAVELRFFEGDWGRNPHITSFTKGVGQKKCPLHSRGLDGTVVNGKKRR